MTEYACIYHKNCADGLTAAVAVFRRLGANRVQYHAATHGETPPDVAGKHVIIVDFSYPYDVIEKMRDSAKSILIIDHHETAKNDLAGYPRPQSDWAEYLADVRSARPDGRAVVCALFDMDRSGAALAWNYFLPGPLPRFVQYVEDRDLWLFKLPESRAVAQWIFSNPYDLDQWSRMVDDFESDARFELMLTEARAIYRKFMKDINELIAATERVANIGGNMVPVANLPYNFASDAANILSVGKPFAAAWYQATTGQIVVSLRSQADGMNVADIARRYGGGGHKHAAGFRLPSGARLATWNK